MLVGAPRGARCIAKHLIVRSNPDNPPGAIRALRLVGAPTPSIFEGDGRRGMRAIPWPEAETGADLLFDTVVSVARIERQRNPGTTEQVARFPDVASLHPGYRQSDGCWTIEC